MVSATTFLRQPIGWALVLSFLFGCARSEYGLPFEPVAGDACTGAGCLGVTGASCQSDGECQDRCLVDVCGPPAAPAGRCDDAADCQPGLECRAGRCAFACNLPMSLADDFEDGVVGSGWEPLVTGDAAVSEVGGRLVFDLQATTNGQALYRSQCTFDIETAVVHVEVPEPVTAAGAGLLDVELRDDAGEGLRFFQDSGALAMGYVTLVPSFVTVAELPYQPVAFRWWRLRTSPSRVYWETAPDGETWTTRAELAWPFSSRRGFFLSLKGANFSGTAAGATVAFDNLNVGLASPADGRIVACPTTSLTDDFDDGLLLPDWFGWAGTGATVGVVSGQVVLTPQSGGEGNVLVQTLSRYALRDAHVSVEVVEVPNPAGTANTGFSFGVDGTFVGFEQSSGQLRLLTAVDWVYDVRATLSYDSVAHRYWRLREAAGELFWETSADGASWTVRSPPTPTPSALAVDGGGVSLDVSNPFSDPAPGQARFDNVNLP